jgi:hypothetical protein
LEQEWKPIIGAYYIKLLKKDIQNNVSIPTDTKRDLRKYIDEYEVDKYAPKMVADFRKYKMI